MLRIEKAILCSFLVVVLAAFASGFSAFATSCGEIRGKVFRLHILANSDSAGDQALKLKVRDRVLAAADELLNSAGGKEKAIETVRRNLDEIQAAAQQEVIRGGYDYPVKAAVVNMYFTTRTYGSYTLPAGYYDALRISIGEAKGHNWWCVLFPPLCLPSARGETQFDDMIGARQADSIKNTSSGYVIKFKSVELFESARKAVCGFFSWLRQSFERETAQDAESAAGQETQSMASYGSVGGPAPENGSAKAAA